MRQCRKDSIGAMLGFYLLVRRGGQLTRESREQSEVQHEGRPWTESSFVPMHTVSTPPGFYLDPLPPGEAYVIVPATFEPNKLGPFMVSVETDVEFLLAKDDVKSRR